jgi:hypothetical protein
MSYDTEDEAIKAAEKIAKEQGFIDFNGNNCSDTKFGEDCLGWDGESRRCSCGNRRVSWSTSQLDSGKWIAYAEAY